MGEVYKAHDTRLRRDVAIKVVAAAFTTDADRLHRFEQEARAAAALNHPNILAVYDIGQYDGSPYIVSELLDGETLRERCASPLPARKAVEYAIQVAHGLAAAHEKGIVHRDLKPENLFITRDERVKILDFGLAKLVQAEGSSTTALPTATAHTHAGTVLGTIGYMAPEQVRGLPVDHRADIFAFGAILYEMLSGTRAFRGDTTADVMTGILKEDPADLPTEGRIPPALARIVDRCLAKSPQARFRSADDLAFALESLSAASWASGGDPALVGVPGRSALGRWTAAAGMLAVGVLVGAAVTALLPRFQHAAPVEAKPAMRLELNLPPGVEPYTAVQSVALSPDGARVAFVGIVAGYRRVYVRDLDKFAAAAVPETVNAITVFFSPNGRAIGVIFPNRDMKKVSLEDRLVVPLATDADFSDGGAWGTDDRITFGRTNGLWQVSASEGTTPTQLTKVDAGKGELRHAFPTVVTGGKALLFTVTTGSSRDAVHIEALSLVTHKQEEVGELGTGPLFVENGRLIFSRDGAVLAAPFDEERLKVTGQAVKVIDERLRLSTLGQPVVAVSGSGSVAYYSGMAANQLVSVSRQGVEQPITDADRTYVFPRLEPPEGRRVIVSADGDLWIKDTVGRAFTMQNTQTTTGNSYPLWTPDGKRVVYRTGTGLYAMDVDSGHPQLIPGTSDLDYPSSVSTNGDTLFFVRLTADSSGDVFTLSLRGEPKPHKLVSTPGYDAGPQLSPDGHWLVYASNASPTEPFQVFVSPYPDAKMKWPVSPNGMFPRWTQKGAELVYRDGNKMMAVDVSIKNGVPTFTSPQQLFADRYMFGSSISIANYDVSPDGQRFVMVKAEPGSSRLNIVLNWFDELRRVGATK